MQSATVDQDKLEQFMDGVVQEMGAADAAGPRLTNNAGPKGAVK